jgi:oxalate decarboxylase
MVSICDSHSKFSTFTIAAGQMFHVDSGGLHHIENLSDTERAEFSVCSRHENPEDFSPSAAFGAMTPTVLGNTYNLPASAVEDMEFSTESQQMIFAKDLQLFR